MSVKLLLDENLSPKVAEALRNEEAIDVCGVRDRGLLEASDAEVLERAFVEDRVLVTKNVADFVKLARAKELHAGIVLLEHGGLLRDEQLALIRRVIAAISSEDMANRALWVAEDGTMRFEEMPPGT